jgi:hypothetical protein
MSVSLDTIEVLRDHNYRTHLVYKTGRTLMHAVVLDGNVRLAHLPLIERRNLIPLEHHGKPYPVARAVRALKRAGRELGITDGARDVLKEIAS